MMKHLKDAGIEPGLMGQIAANDGDLGTVAAGGATATVTVSVRFSRSICSHRSRRISPLRMAVFSARTVAVWQAESASAVAASLLPSVSSGARS